MNVVVYAEERAGSYPGHMVIGEETDGGIRAYFGFRFDPADLHEDYRQPEQWRNYLFENAVRGRIVDETNYVLHLLILEDGARSYYEKRAESATAIESRLPPRDHWEPHAWYSFNPDNPHPGREPCYNCVKWAIIIGNSLVEGFLLPVRQGRLKLVLEQLQRHPS